MAEDVQLLKTERNAIFELVTHSGLEVAHFEWGKFDRFEEPIVMHGITYTTVSVLIHVPSQFHYRFGKYYDQTFPGINERVERRDVFKQGSEYKWKYRITIFQEWLTRLREEIDAPDFWDEIGKAKPLALAAAEMPAEETFAEKEKLYFAVAVERIEADLHRLNQLTASQSEAIHCGFEEIKAEMNRFGKKDWINNATGLLFNIMVNSAFAPSAARDLYNMFVAAVAPLLDVAHKLLQ